MESLFKIYYYWFKNIRRKSPQLVVVGIVLETQQMASLATQPQSSLRYTRLDSLSVEL